MIVQVHEGDVRVPPTVLSGPMVVIRAPQGHPIAVFHDRGVDGVLMTSARDPDFEKVLEGMGFHKRAIPEVERRTITPARR